MSSLFSQLAKLQEIAMANPTRRTHCVLCCDRISGLLVSSKAQVKLLTKWKQSCLSSFCQTLKLDPSSLVEAGFCLRCHQLLRDMDFMVRSIERFQKRLRTLKNRAKAMLTINVKELGQETHAYAKTVRNILATITQSESEAKAISGVHKKENGIYGSVAVNHGNKYERTTRIRKLKQFSNNELWGSELDEEKIGSGGDSDYQENCSEDCQDPNFKIAGDTTEPAIKIKCIKSDKIDPTKAGIRAKVKKPRRVVGRAKLRCSYPHCAVFSWDPMRIEAHVREVHEADPAPYHCPQDQCDLKFKNFEMLQRHQRDAHGLLLKTYRCTPCSRTYRSKQRYAAHVSEFHPKTSPKHLCSVCTKSFDTPDLMQQHTEFHNSIRASDRPFACVVCDVFCASMLELQAHVFKEHEDSLKCPSEGCDKVFLTKTRLYYHCKIHHTERDRSYLVCPKCSYQSTAPSALKRHLRKHDPPESGLLKCDRQGCEKMFRYKNTLNRHKKLDHDRDPAALFQCTLCPKAFTQSSTLTSHQAHHSKMRPFLCEHCSLSFKTIQNLRNHYKVHKEQFTDERRRSIRSKPRRARLPPVLTEPKEGCIEEAVLPVQESSESQTEEGLITQTQPQTHDQNSNESKEEMQAAILWHSPIPISDAKDFETYSMTTDLLYQ